MGDPSSEVLLLWKGVMLVFIKSCFRSSILHIFTGRESQEWNAVESLIT